MEMKLDMDRVRAEVVAKLQQMKDGGIPLTYFEEGKLVVDAPTKPSPKKYAAE